jgi:hypothetical protein
MKFIAFDCATKTLGYCAIEVCMGSEKIFDIGGGKKTTDLFTFNWLFGDVVNLIPDMKDGDIHSVRRVKALCKFLDEKINALVDKDFVLLIEFQMGGNPKARMIASALIAYFHNLEHIYLVGPSLKNKYKLYEGGELDSFLEGELLTGKRAVKEQSKANFKYAVQKYKFPIKLPEKLYEHISDAFMHIVGFCCEGTTKEKF